ncbi:MAG: phage scaffolding protein [Butyrivibrio sp.]|nr:phage scaffolding protein [Butyrivibrio sp.]
MKNIEAILTENNVQITDEQKKAVAAAVGENYKTAAEWEEQAAKLAEQAKKVEMLTESLEKFKGVDAEGLGKQIDELKAQLEAKDKEFAEKEDARNLTDTVNEAIRKAGGRNIKAITALLDLDALRTSKNRDKDVSDAVEALTKAEDSAMLFGNSEVGKLDIPGKVTRTASVSDDSAMREVMGLPPVGENKA